jgi:ABC-type spermidine/putrescine transport system permease subunit I
LSVTLLIFFIIPLFSLGRLSLSSGGFSNYSTVISDNSTVIVRTFVYASIATLAAIIIGYPLAYVIATKGGRFKNMLLALVVLPFFVTYLVRTLSWKILLFDGGPVVSILHSVGVLNENQGILGSPFAVVAALALVLSAVYVLWTYQRMMTGPVTDGNDTLTDLRPRELLVVAPLIVLLLVLGVYPKPALDVINPAVTHTLTLIHQPDPAPTLGASK